MKHLTEKARKVTSLICSTGSSQRLLDGSYLILATRNILANVSSRWLTLVREGRNVGHVYILDRPQRLTKTFNEVGWQALRGFCV